MTQHPASLLKVPLHLDAGSHSREILSLFMCVLKECTCPAESWSIILTLVKTAQGEGERGNYPCFKIMVYKLQKGHK